MNNENIEWNSVEPDVWKSEQEGDQIQGVLIAIEPKDDANDISARYYLSTKDGNKMVWGSAVIDDRMKLVRIGDLIRITYNGETKNKAGRKVNLFRIDVGKPKAKTTETSAASNPAVIPTEETVN